MSRLEKIVAKPPREEKAPLVAVIPLRLQYRLYKTIEKIRFEKKVQKKGLLSRIVELALEEYLNALEKELKNGENTR